MNNLFIKKARIYRGGALGDFIVTLPVFKKIKSSFEPCYLEVVTRSPAALLAKEVGLIDSIVSLESQEHLFLFNENCEISQNEKEKLGSFDLIISYLNDSEKIIEKQFRKFFSGKLLFQTPFPMIKHISQHLLEPLKELNIETNSIENILPLLNRNKVDRESIKNLLKINELHKKIIIIHPGSGSPAKNYPLENFFKIYDMLSNAESFIPFFILGEAEEEMKQEVFKRGYSFLYNLPLSTVADLLSVSSFYIGNDSGITHLAAALNIPTLVLFGPTSPAFWRPLGKKVYVIYEPNLDAFKNICPTRILKIIFDFFEI